MNGWPKKYFMKAIILILLAPFIIALSVYGILLVANRNDQQPSQAYVLLTDKILKRQAIPENENAYVFLMGFSAPENESPLEYGRRITLEINEWISKNPYEYYEEKDQSGPKISKNLRTAIAACDGYDKTCIESLFVNRKNLENEIRDSQQLIQRYQELIAKPSWVETNIATLYTPFPPYAEVMDAQKVYLADAWLKSFGGHPEMARKAIEGDHIFWRMMLANTDTLIGKMIAVTALRRNYVIGSLAFISAPLSASVPSSWGNEISESELSLEKVYGGELLFSDSFFRKDGSALNLSSAYHPDEFSLMEELESRMLSPIFKHQATQNAQAEYFLSNVKVFNAPLGEYPEIIANLEANKKQGRLPTWLRLYNPVGAAMADGASIYIDYHARVADLEGVRRLAILSLRLHGRHVQPEDIEYAIDASDLRNPYDGSPFKWDKKSGFLTFRGLENDCSRNIFSFFYRP